MFNESELPFVMINGAVSADGKLALENRSLIQFSSDRDRELVFKLRSKVDAVLSGARTVEIFSIDLAAGGKKWRDQRTKQGLSPEPLRVIATGSASLTPRARIFRKRVSPIIILTAQDADARKVRALRNVADEVKIFGQRRVSFAPALRWLRDKYDVKSLVCEGGGETNAALLGAGVVDELHLTVCPLLLFGRHAPTISDGDGVGSLKTAPRLQLKSVKHVKGEVFLVYQVLGKKK